MKRIKYLLVVLVFGFAFNAQAQNKETDPDYEFVFEEEGYKTYYTSIHMKNFASMACSKVESLGANDDVGKHLENLFLRFLRITRETPNYKNIIAAFWNKHSSEFICVKTRLGSVPSPQHLMKRVVTVSSHNVVFDTFILTLGRQVKDVKKDRPLIDLNAIEINQRGEEETVIDYINSIISIEENKKRYDIADLKALIATLSVYGAKTAKDLKN
ncbi:hypothetical protein [Flaviramulus aquimarinus]